MKKLLKLFLIMFICLAVVGCESGNSKVEEKGNDDTPIVVKKELAFDVYTCELEIGGTKAITVSKEGVEGTITWVSSNESVATVNNGTITAIAAGKCSITGTIDGVSKTVEVTVRSPEKQQVPGTISLDSDCNISYSKTAYSVQYSGYNFEFYDTNEYSDGYVSLSKGGYILNTTPFGDIDSFQVEYTVDAPDGKEVQSDLGFGGLYYVTDTHLITSPRSYARQEVVNNTLVTLSDNPNYISFYTYNEIDIKSITISYNTDAKYTEVYTDFEVQVFATNDIHGQVNADDTHAGFENASGYIEEQKKNSKYNILLDQGDIYQGSLACYLTEGHVADDYLLMNGYDSTILGNHEWDWMEENILEHRVYSPEVKLLACNVRYKDGTTPSWVQNYYVTERGGVQFGVIGALGDIAGDISADMIENIKFVTGTELTNMIAQFSQELKALGCDYIILQIHAGSNSSSIKNGTNAEYTEVDYSSLQGKVDLVLESHSHRNYYHIDSYGIAHMQCGGYFSGFGNVVLQVSFTGNQPTVSIKSYDILNASELKAFDSEFFSEVNEWYSTNVYKEKSEEVVCTLDSEKDDVTINQLAANAYYNLKNIYPELKNYDICVGGGHIQCRSPKKLEKGNATFSDITNLFPFDNEMYLVKIAGRDLKYNFLNRNGYYVAGIYTKDSTLDFKKDYYIIIDSYNFFYLTKQLQTPADVSIVVNLTTLYGVHPREALAIYLKQEYPIKDISTVEITNTKFDYTKTSAEFDVKDGVKLYVTYAGLTDNASYSQFVVNKNQGTMTFTCSEGYKITSVEIKQYQKYTNLKYYSDSECKNEITYSITGTDNNPTYTLDNNTNTFVIKNPSNYDVKLFYVLITIEKTN